MNEGLTHKTDFLIEKFRVVSGMKYPVPYEVVRFSKNLGLTAGLTLLGSLMCGGAGTAFDSASAYLGVGDSTTAAAVGQTGLQGSNKAYAGMEAGYPTFGSSPTVTWKASFGDGEAQYAWEEFTLENADLGSGTAFFRKTSSKGTKAGGEVWDITVSVTFGS